MNIGEAVERRDDDDVREGVLPGEEDEGRDREETGPVTLILNTSGSGTNLLVSVDPGAWLSLYDCVDPSAWVLILVHGCQSIDLSSLLILVLVLVLTPLSGDERDPDLPRDMEGQGQRTRDWSQSLPGRDGLLCQSQVGVNSACVSLAG